MAGKKHVQKKTKKQPIRGKGKRKTSKRTMKGGRVHMPGAYFGTPSKVFTPDAAAGYEPSAYGETVPVSYGVMHNGMTGPDLGVFPNASGVQTGGCGCGGCGVLPNMTGGGKKKRSQRKHKK
jgi:hypothetical protein